MTRTHECSINRGPDALQSAATDSVKSTLEKNAQARAVVEQMKTDVRAFIIYELAVLDTIIGKVQEDKYFWGMPNTSFELLSPGAMQTTKLLTLATYLRGFDQEIAEIIEIFEACKSSIGELAIKKMDDKSRIPRRSASWVAFSKGMKGETEFPLHHYLPVILG